jgi:cell division septum initiation protein DivIVA
VWILTEKELKKLNRYQLLELLVIQSEQIKDMQHQIEEMQKLLDSRDIQMSVVGSIAEASLQLGGVFTAAQKSADIYLAAVQERLSEIEASAMEEAERIIQQAQLQADKILADAEKWREINDIMMMCQYGADDK